MTYAISQIFVCKERVRQELEKAGDIAGDFGVAGDSQEGGVVAGVAAGE